MKPSGYFYNYNSRFTGAPCVAILTMKSANPKTGNIPQIWYLSLNEDQRDVCGSCALQGAGCYVLWFKAPLTILRAYDRGRYAPLSDLDTDIAYVRDGACGDPASMDKPNRRTLMRLMGNPKRKGYTHAWRTIPWLRLTTMASCDTLSAARAAQAHGWSTFRAVASQDDAQPNELMCPGDCSICSGCQGINSHNRVVVAHGARANRVLELGGAAYECEIGV